MVALGAILKYAVTATVAGISIQTAAVILMVAGVIGLVVSLFLEFAYVGRRRPLEVEVGPSTSRSCASNTRAQSG